MSVFNAAEQNTQSCHRGTSKVMPMINCVTPNRESSAGHGQAFAAVRHGCVAASLIALMWCGISAAGAADLVRVGKASSTTFAFAPVEIGKEKGIWAKHNLDVESIAF